MRMWMVDPAIMCRKHLLGEHVEIHMLVGAMRKGKSIQGYIDKGLISIEEIPLRHSDIVTEMLKRNYNHKSDIDMMELRMLLMKYDKAILSASVVSGVDWEKSLSDLTARCPDCLFNLKNLLALYSCSGE